VRRSVSLTVLTLPVMSSCGQPFAPAADTTTLDESGLSLADHAGATLVILDLSPARLGDNTARVRLRDPGGRLIGGSAQLSLRRGGRQLATVNLTANTGEGRLGIDGADDYELVVDAAPRGEPSGTVHFAVRLPAEPASASLLQRVDTTMNQLRGLRESQTLTSGAFVYVFSFDYQSPDRTHYSFTGPEGMRHETLLIGTRRFDREGPGPWSETDLGIPVAAPNFAYSDGAHRVRQIGRENVGGRDTLVFALVSGAAPVERYYRLWIDAASLQVERYTMMATGHYMGGSYRDFDAAIEINPPRP